MSNEVLEPQQPNSETPVPDETCAKCHTTASWGSSSWCPDCGYYPGISDALPEHEREVDPNALVEEQTVAEKQPLLAQWIILAIAGPTTILVLSIAARYYFTYFGGDRSLFSFIMFLLGIVSFVGAHVLTSIRAMQADSGVTPFDVIGKPIEMWRPTIQDLPKTGNRIVFGVCGVTAIISALVITGGIDFGSIFANPWVERKEEKAGVISRLMHSAPEADGDPDKTMEETLEELAPIPQELDEATQALLPSADKPLTCVVYGYMKDGENDFGRLLLAANIGGQRVHVGTMDAKNLPDHVRQNLASRLRKLERSKRSVDSRYNGTWVEPSIGLNISFDSWSISGELANPRISLNKDDNDKDK